MAWVATGAAVVGGVSKFLGGRKAARAAARRKRKLKKKLDHLERNRQEIINPYAGATNLSGMATDLSSQMSNPYKNLGVATQAAEMQAEQTDIALANTLDTIRATGSGAGGATALAQAALAAKKGITASIESQEAANQKQRAAGEAQLQNQIMSEKKRLQQIQMSEGQRMQNLDAAGKQFVFSQRETREVSKINRVAGQLDNARQQQAQANADAMSAVTGTIGAIGQIGASGAFKSS